MTTSDADQLIRQWRGRFRKDPLAAGVVLGLRDRSDEIWQYAFGLLQHESPEYRNSVDAEFTKESKAHCNELLRMIVAVSARRVQKSAGDPFNFVRTHAEWRARHQVPLIASLHAYRLAHRTYWNITREALLRHSKQNETIVSLTTLSDFWIEFFDHVAAVLAEAHAVEEGLIIAQSTRTYVALIDDLLRGLMPRDAEGQRLCTLCGIRPGAPMAVFVTRPPQSGNGEQLDFEATLRSFVRLIEQALTPSIFGKLVDIRNGEVTAIACNSANTSRALMDTLRRNSFPRRVGSRYVARVGISMDVADVALLPQALEEARLALEFASTAQPLMHFSDIDLREFLVRRADNAAIRLVPEWTRYFSSIEGNPSRELSRTIHTFADCNFNVKQTAQRLSVHTNTIYFRLNRIKKLTGINPRTYSGTSHLLTALRLREIRENRSSK